MKYRFHTTPFRHQRRGLKRLWKNGGGALFWEPGTGKTKTTLDFISALYLRNPWPGMKVLILCPINAMQVWPDQMAMHMGAYHSVLIPSGTISQKATEIQGWEGVGIEFIILNYDAIIKRDQQWLMMKALEEWGPDVLVLDESQKVKNATAKRSKAAHRLGLDRQHVVLLSGTPVSKNYLDLYSQLKVIDPRIWWDSALNKVLSWTQFRHRYGIWGGFSGYELRGYQHLDDLRSRYRSFISTARKRDCLDLPDATDVIVPVEMNAAVKRLYDLFSIDGMIVYDRHLLEAPIVLTKLLRLQEMTGGWVHDEVGEVVELHRDKVAVLKGLIEDLKEAGEKTIIFARFRAEMAAILEAIDTPLIIRGGVTNEGRKRAVRQFIESDKLDPMVIQIAAGESLDGLQEVCSNIVFFSTDYSLDHYTQARGRIERAGQKDPITFWHLHCIGTVDKLVYRALRQKKDLERMVMDDPMLLVVDR